MNKKITMVSALLLSAVTLSSAQANWFSNHKQNTMFNLGSVRNPTPEELRAYRHENEVALQQRRARQQGADSPQATESVFRPFWGLFR
jgi:hypothetical protein